MIRLAGAALDHWDEIDGYAVSHNMPELETLPVKRFTSFIYWYLTRNADASGLAKFKASLWRPPPGQPGKGPWAPEAENAALSGLKASLGK